MKITEAHKARFWSRVQKTDGCWDWTAALSHYGYGEFYLGETSYRAHRVSWILLCGEIPPGLCVCHHCDNRKCVRPDHLFLGTHNDNMQDMKQKDRRKQTACKKGHELTDDNVAYRSNSRGKYRLCKICERANWLRQYYRKKEPKEQAGC